MCVIGTRPEYLKIKSLILKAIESNIDVSILFTGQHSDLIEDYNFPCPVLYHHYEVRSSNRLNDIIINVVNAGDSYFGLCDAVLVQGDTASAFAAAQCAKNMGKQVIHLEAGLRTYDLRNPYPEESFRQQISRIADIHFCPTQNNRDNIENELCDGLTYIVGNTSIDNLSGIITYENIILCTLHRRENRDNMIEWFSELSKLAKDFKDYRFILPLHPSCKKFKNALDGVDVIDPIDHERMMELLRKATLVITDSGGLQEEASFFRKKTIVCRKITERQEALYDTSFLCQSPNKLKDLFWTHLCKPVPKDAKCPFGDGKAAEKICKILKNEGF